MAQALGMSPRGNALPRFLATRAMSGVGGAELGQKLDNPLRFQSGGGGAGMPPTTVHGSDATLLIEICQAILNAKTTGKLVGGRYDRMVAQAQIILSASAKNGIKGLVYALVGYNPTAPVGHRDFKRSCFNS